ncbi:NAD-dependent epimerase/dehydratase family protein [Natronomonas sp. F2-12]|jgi:UDP-glucose 4-epimerase|uniref:NAD-dependent epimerase/dehydratase family protein n=1 Tax=Natronomonas aquatica TaxID=2841590 RepID=A0A9R1CQH5_9EURY|nr:NAD-dependent epimerase/dehydratase family protein [Natronomonas aquatica]MCQ4333203.1 NAD-dependent epimerase/dehydratase family protein [Natronomonas aquatica]
MTAHTTQRTLVTGGAGFIGSHLTRRLDEAGHDVTVVDDLSNGRRGWVPDDVRFLERDLTERDAVEDVVAPEYDLLVHLASRKAVDDPDPRSQFRENTDMTYDLVEAALDAGVPDFLFTSSSTVYGEAPRPTPEDYAPLEPISAYGASKLACEGILSTAAHAHDLTVYNVRFANIVGPRLRGAVVPDFIEKLRDDPETLTILGDGRQEKSYMHVEDCIDAMLSVYEHAEGPMATYNLGTRTTTSVNRIADVVADEMGLAPDYEYTGGDRGWTGDVPKMRLSIEKLAALGWEPSIESTEAVRRTARELLEEL